MQILLLAAGSNAHGQLAIGTLEDAHSFSTCLFEGSPAGSLPSDTRKIIKVVGGANHTLALLDITSHGPQLWGCGDGRRGQLGIQPNSIADAAERAWSFRRIDSGPGWPLSDCQMGDMGACWETSFVAVRSPGGSDKLLSMGSDDFGLRGLGVTDGSHPAVSEVQLSRLATRVQRIVIQSIACGPRHVLVHLRLLSSSDSYQDLVVGWGASRHGQLGPLIDPKSGRALPFVSSPCNIPLRSSDGPVVALAAGAQHSVILHSSGRLTVLGSNVKMQLRGLNTLDNVCGVGCTWNGTYVLGKLEDNVTLCATGSNNKGQLGAGLGTKHMCALPTRVQLYFSPGMLQLACGSEHVLCLCTIATEDDTCEVWGWGWNEHGNLGLGTMDDAGVPVRVWPPPSATERAHSDAAIKRPVGIWAGCGTSWIALE